jgi:hypothetical protein
MNGNQKKKTNFGGTVDIRKYLITKVVNEEFKDIGKLSPDQLTKGQYLNPNDKNNFTRVSGRVFFMAIKKIKENDIAKANKGLPSKGLQTLSFYNAGEYDKMKCYLGKNNSSGYVIDNGTLKSVFSSQKSSGDAIMVDAIANGAKELDCYVFRYNGILSGPLYKLYTKHGFRVDTSFNTGKPGKPYTVVNGVSDYVNSKGQVEPDNPKVVIFMKR